MDCGTVGLLIDFPTAFGFSEHTHKRGVGGIPRWYDTQDTPRGSLEHIGQTASDTAYEIHKNDRLSFSSLCPIVILHRSSD